MIKYILTDWPECQVFEEHERFDECIWGADGMILFVPEDLYNEVIKNK